MKKGPSDLKNLIGLISVFRAWRRVRKSFVTFFAPVPPIGVYRPDDLHSFVTIGTKLGLVRSWFFKIFHSSFEVTKKQNILPYPSLVFPQPSSCRHNNRDSNNNFIPVVQNSKKAHHSYLLSGVVGGWSSLKQAITIFTYLKSGSKEREI